MFNFTEDLGNDLINLLNLEPGERGARNKIFDQLPTPYGRQLFSYYRTCSSIQKEMKDAYPRNQYQISDSKFPNSFEMEIINKPVLYHRKTILPNEVRPYFEKLIFQWVRDRMGLKETAEDRRKLIL